LQSTLSLSSVSKHHNINFKAPALLYRHWTSADTIIRVQNKSEKLGVRAWLYKRPSGSVLESSVSFQLIENETKHLPRPSFGEAFLQRHFDGK